MYSCNSPELEFVRWYFKPPDFPDDSVVKKPPDNAGDAGDRSLIPGSGRSPGGGNGNPLQYSCLENPMERGAWWATIHGVVKSLTKLTLHFTLHILLCRALSHGFYLCCNFCFSGSLVSELQHRALLSFCKVVLNNTCWYDCLLLSWTTQKINFLSLGNS